MATGTALVGELLAAIGKVGVKAGPGPTGVEDDSAPIDVQLLFLQALLADTLPSAPELEPVADDVTALLADAPAIVTLDDAVSMAARVRATTGWLLVAGVPIKAAAAQALPQRWLPDLAGSIVARSWELKGLWADCVVRAWAGAPVDAAAERAGRANRDFAEFVCGRYLNPPGLPVLLDQLQDRRDYLVSLKTTLTHTPLSGPPGSAGVNDVDLGATDPQGAWVVGRDLRDELDTYRAQYRYGNVNTAELYADVLRLTQRVQRTSAMITALALDEEVLWAAQEIALAGDLRARLNGYDAELKTIITTLHGAFPDGGQGQVDATNALAALAARPAFAADRDSALTNITVQHWVKTVAIGVAIAGVAALVGPEAFALGGQLMTILGAEGASVLVGALAAEAFVVTVINRTAATLINGPDAVEQTPFWLDFLLTAATVGTIKAVGFGYGRIFLQAEGTVAFKAGQVATQALTMTAVTGVLQRARSGEWPTLGQAGATALEQLVVGLVLTLVAGQVQAFSRRNAALAPRLAPDDLARLDQGAAALRTRRDTVLRDGATAAELEAFLQACADQWNAEVKAVAALPAGDPDAPAALARYAQVKAQLELVLAMRGFVPALDPSGLPPAFTPKGPGVVAYGADARTVVDTVFGANVREIGPGVLLGTAAGGRMTLFVPVEVYPGGTARPQLLLTAEAAAASGGADEDLVSLGRANLAAFAKGRLSVDAVLAEVGPARAESLLAVMSHPSFDPVANAGAYSRADLVALGRSDEACWFAINRGVRLAVKIKRAAGGASTNVFGPSAIDLLRRADAYIAAAPDPAAAVAELTGLGSPQLKVRLAPATPAAPKQPVVNENSLGVGRDTPEWAALRTLQGLRNATRSTPLTDAQLDVRADVDQAVEMSKRGRFSKWSFARRLKAVDRLNTIMQGGGYASRPASGIRGLVVERLFIPGYRPGDKIAFLNGRVVPLGTTGDTELDWVFDHHGGLGGGEIKSDRLDLMTTPGQISSTITGYCTEGMQDVLNAPSGMHYRLYFPFAPKTDALVQRAVTDARTFPWPGTMDLVFGDSPPITIR